MGLPAAQVLLRLRVTLHRHRMPATWKRFISSFPGPIKAIGRLAQYMRVVVSTILPTRQASAEQDANFSRSIY